MAQLVEKPLTAAEKDTLWRQYQAGETFASIGRILGRHVSTIYSIVSFKGGIAPKQRQRADVALSTIERESISRGLSAGQSIRAMARALGRALSTVSREVARNGGPARYRAVDADPNAWRRAKRPKQARLLQHPQLRLVVHEKLRQHWSPVQISGWLAREYPLTMNMRVSHETIYRSVFVQMRGAAKRELTSRLRTRRQMRRSKRAHRAEVCRGGIVDAVSIARRRVCVGARAMVGHWEGDLISGSKHSHIATLVERHSRYVLLVHVRGKDTTSVVDALIREVQRLPSGAMTSLT
jgi:IS30 family transposase